jgi:hypothetical protein
MRVMDVVAAGTTLGGFKGFSRRLNSERLPVQASVFCVALQRRQVQALKFAGFQFRDLRCLRGIVPLSVATVQVELSSEVKASPSTQDILDWDLEGWKVVLDETGEAVGRVEEVLSLASYWDPSVVEYCLVRVFDSSSPSIEYLILWVADVVKEEDIKAQCILIKPPDGLLELAKRPELLRKIRIELESFGRLPNGLQICCAYAQGSRTCAVVSGRTRCMYRPCSDAISRFWDCEWHPLSELSKFL